MKKLHKDDSDKRKPKRINDDGRGWERTKKQTLAATNKLYGSSGSRQLPKRHSKTNLGRKPGSTNTPKASAVNETGFDDVSNEENRYSNEVDFAPDKENSDDHHHHRLHAERLIKLNQLKDRLRGQYIRFDIPNGLDDTAARFVAAVAQRYNFVCPQSSTLHNDSFIHNSNTNNSSANAESIIQQLHAKGLVFIRQLQPSERMEEIFYECGVPVEFIALASQLMLVLHQARGNHMSRKYLMAECKNFLSTQNATSARSKRKSKLEDMSSRLGEFGISESDDLDSDIPGGLWANAVAKDKRGSNVPKEPEPSSRHCMGSNSRKPKNWAVAYTKKVLASADEEYPAFDLYRHYDLLSSASSQTANIDVAN